MGGHFASLILNWKEDYIARVNTVPCCPGRSIKKLVWNLYSWIKIAVFLLFVGQDIVAACCKQASKTSQKCHVYQWWSDEVSFTSHFSGLIVGLLFGLVIVENRNEERWERVVKIISGVLLIVSAAIAVIAVVSVDVSTKEKAPDGANQNVSANCSHKYSSDYETIAWDVSTAVAMALVFLVFCLLLCTKGKRKMFRTLYARKIGGMQNCAGNSSTL